MKSLLLIIVSCFFSATSQATLYIRVKNYTTSEIKYYSTEKFFHIPAETKLHYCTVDLSKEAKSKFLWILQCNVLDQSIKLTLPAPLIMIDCNGGSDEMVTYVSSDLVPGKYIATKGKNFVTVSCKPKT